MTVLYDFLNVENCDNVHVFIVHHYSVSLDYISFAS